MPAHVDGITADSLNTHYASVSTDPQYAQPSHKSSCSPSFNQFVSELTIFRILDKLRPTSTGRDSIPSWFLCPCAQYLIYSISPFLPHLSHLSGSVHGSLQSPKVSSPMAPVDFRPISITPFSAASWSIFLSFVNNSYTLPSSPPLQSHWYSRTSSPFDPPVPPPLPWSGSFTP